jgi:hypothetical protein
MVSRVDKRNITKGIQNSTSHTVLKRIGFREAFMTNDIFALLLDKRETELNGKSVESGLNKTERAELRALNAHRDKAPAVTQRIRILAAKMAQPNKLGLLLLRFSRKFKQNLAELEALVQFGNSRAVWEIAYLYRRRASQKLTPVEKTELHFLTLFNDSPDVVRITELKVKESQEALPSAERQELKTLQTKSYSQEGIPAHLLDMFWPSQNNRQPFDLTALN